MVREIDKHIMGWLAVYIIGSIPVLLFWAAGLSGWFLDYPLELFLGIFFMFTIPLWLLLLKHPRAKQWNIVLVWTGSILITIRIVYGVLLQGLGNVERLLEGAPILLGVVVFSIGWAMAWTKRFGKR